jgi:hypothetical protein
MLPRWHILYGAVFTLVIYLASPSIPPIYFLLLFFSSFLIDFDHYVCFFLNTGKLSLKESFKYHDELMKIEDDEASKGIRRRGDFHLFHTLEFQILIGLLSFVWIGFFYIFIGLIFHTLIDMLHLLRIDRFYRKEFFFFSWLRRRV